MSCLVKTIPHVLEIDLKTTPRRQCRKDSDWNFQPKEKTPRDAGVFIGASLLLCLLSSVLYADRSALHFLDATARPDVSEWFVPRVREPQ